METLTLPEIDGGSGVRGEKKRKKEMDKPSRQKISKDIAEFNSTINKLDIIDIYRLFHSASASYIFSNSHGTFTKTDQIQGHKKDLDEFKRINIIQ